MHDAHQGEDNCPGWLDRAQALDEYAGKVGAALVPLREYLPAVLVLAFAATATRCARDGCLFAITITR